MGKMVRQTSRLVGASTRKISFPAGARPTSTMRWTPSRAVPSGLMAMVFLGTSREQRICSCKWRGSRELHRYRAPQSTVIVLADVYAAAGERDRRPLRPDGFQRTSAGARLMTISEQCATLRSCPLGLRGSVRRLRRGFFLGFTLTCRCFRRRR